MFKRRTLFILGAGASVEVDIPAGPRLAAIISKKMDVRSKAGNPHPDPGDRELFGAVVGNRHDLAGKFQQAGWRIRDGVLLSQSIDDFLDLHRTNELVQIYGKAAIVKTILEAEAGSKLFYNERTGGTFDPGAIANTWYVKFMHMLARGVSRQNVTQIFDNVSFIVFNYDRCVEFFLLNALQNLYGLPTTEAADILSDLNIIHPYGSISEHVPFGAVKDQDYVALADDIKTYTEQLTNAEISARLRMMVADAACIIFLGFAYHSQNMLLLKPAAPGAIRYVYGTAYNMSNADVDVVTHQIADFFSPDADPQLRFRRIHLENELTSARLFDYYAKSLSGGD